MKNEEEYQRVLNQILQVIDGKDVDNVVPALVTTLSSIMYLHDISETEMVSFIADAFEITKEEGRRVSDEESN